MKEENKQNKMNLEEKELEKEQKVKLNLKQKLQRNKADKKVKPQTHENMFAGGGTD